MFRLLTLIVVERGVVLELLAGVVLEAALGEDLGDRHGVLNSSLEHLVVDGLPTDDGGVGVDVLVAFGEL